MLSGHLHECVKALIMLFVISSMDDNIICYSDYTFTVFQDLVHHPLKDVLGTSKAPGEMDKPVMSPQGVEHHEEGRFIVKDNT